MPGTDFSEFDALAVITEDLLLLAEEDDFDALETDNLEVEDLLVSNLLATSDAVIGCKGDGTYEEEFGDQWDGI